MMRIGLELSNEEVAFFTIKFKDGDQHARFLSRKYR